MSSIKHTVNGIEYEIRSMLTDDGAFVTIFHNGKQISPPYTIDAETMKDSKHSSLPLTMDSLFEQAKSDLDEGIVK